MNFSKYILAAIILTSLLSCETTEKIDDFPLRPAKMVANCYFSADSVWEIQVSQSLSVLDNADLKFVSDATVLLYRDSTFIDTVKRDFDDVYRSYVSLPVENRSYSISITSSKFKTPVTAEAMTPVSVPISDVNVTIRDSSFHTESYSPEESYTWGEIKGDLGIVIDDPEDLENYYELSVYKYYIYEQYYDDTTTYYQIEKDPIRFSTEDPVAEDYHNDDWLSSIMFSDEIFNGQEYEVTISFDDYINYSSNDIVNSSHGNSYHFELKSLSREGYLYRKTIETYEQSNGDPFSEPVVIYSNVENGYGIFAGYALSYFSKEIFE